MSARLVMGFDYGTTKVGVAVGQSVTGTATPIAVMSSKDGAPDWRAIEKLVSDWAPDMFVVGLPLNMDGSESEMSQKARRFARQLTGRYHIAHQVMDERLTSREAVELTKPGEPVDAVAAKLIVESWFREN